MKYEIDFINDTTLNYKGYTIKIVDSEYHIHQFINSSKAVRVVSSLFKAVRWIDTDEFLMKNKDFTLRVEMMNRDTKTIMHINPKMLIGKKIDLIVKDNSPVNSYNMHASFSNLYWKKDDIKVYISKVNIHTSHPLYEYHNERNKNNNILSLVFRNDILISAETHHNMDDSFTFINQQLAELK